MSITTRRVEILRFRGACPCVAAGDHYIRDWPTYRRWQQSEVGIIALVETHTGLQNIDEICRCHGLKGLLIGPFDLSVSLCHDGDYRHPEVLDAIESTIATAASNEVPIVMPVFLPELHSARDQVDQWRSRRGRTFVIGTDKILVSNQFKSYLSSMLD